MCMCVSELLKYKYNDRKCGNHFKKIIKCFNRVNYSISPEKKILGKIDITFFFAVVNIYQFKKMITL